MNLMKLAFWRDTKEELVNEHVENRSEGNVIDFPKTQEQ